MTTETLLRLVLSNKKTDQATTLPVPLQCSYYFNLKVQVLCDYNFQTEKKIMDQVRVQQIHVSFIIGNGNTSQLIQMFATCKLNKSHKDKNKKA